MANTKEIKDRISSIEETQKITNAMYLISSTKLRKARKSLEGTEPYFYSMEALLARLERHLPDISNPYFESYEKVAPQDRTAGFLVITADKGLAGAYNHNVLKLAEQEMAKHTHNKLYVVGELGRQYFAARQVPVDEQFHYTAQDPNLDRSRIITIKILEDYTNGRIHELYVIYTVMVNSLEVEPRIEQILPLHNTLANVEIPEGVMMEDINLEPSPNAVINAVVPITMNGLIYSALIESFCAEQNARMTAMQSANKAANDFLHDLQIQYNRVRQSVITQEITEVCSGAKAQKRK